MLFGKKSTAEAQFTVLSPLIRCEIFFEVLTTGVGTGIGNIELLDKYEEMYQSNIIN